MGIEEVGLENELMCTQLAQRSLNHTAIRSSPQTPRQVRRLMWRRPLLSQGQLDMHSNHGAQAAALHRQLGLAVSLVNTDFDVQAAAST